jgi:hypothetical protein
MMYTHEWQAVDGEYETLVNDLGKDRVRVVAAINWKSDKVQVWDDHKAGWVVVVPGDYVIENEGKVWVTSGR